MGRNEDVSFDVLKRICGYLNCVAIGSGLTGTKQVVDIFAYGTSVKFTN